MQIAFLIVILVVIPLGLYYLRQYKMNTPSLQWPVLGRILNLTYEPAPPRLQGTRHGRPVTIDIYQQGVRLATVLSKPSRLRVEIGPKDEVTKRSGMLVPDPIITDDSAFNERLLVRCSEKAAGLKLLDPVLRQRLMAQPIVEILGQGAMVQWLLPVVKEPDPTEDVLDILTVIAEEMERFPEI